MEAPLKETATLQIRPSPCSLLSACECSPSVTYFYSKPAARDTHTTRTRTCTRTHTIACLRPQQLPGKAGGTLQWALISSLRFGVRQGDDIVIVTLVGLHGSIED